MTVLVLFLPLTALVLSFTRVNVSGLLCGNMVVASVLASYHLLLTMNGKVTSVVLSSNFLSLFNYQLTLGVYLDFYSAYMVWVVCLISALVHLYSTVYMAHDPRVNLFLIYLTLFTFFMLVLLVSPNLLQLFMGWEGVGLTSYLLVNFWHTRTQANKSALKALLVNRVGDLFFLYALFSLLLTAGTLEFVGWSEVHPLVAPSLVVAACAKSAQLGLHTWLPDAMEGPTPVSALIHAATMVTAGLFLLFRTTDYLLTVRPLLLTIGAATALFAGTVAAFQFDLKRVIAYSTCSQLGYMTVAVSLNLPELSLYHLANHAFFKALLFLLAGLVIHSVHDEQDMRRHGGLVNLLPVTYTLWVVASFALGGFPFLSGFYSKDLILEVLYSQGHFFAYFSCLLAAYLTVYYSLRTVVLVFYGTNNSPPRVAAHTHEADWLSLLVVSLLGFFSLVHGYVVRDLLVGQGVPLSWAASTLQAEFVTPLWVKLAPLAVTVVSVFVYVTGSGSLSFHWRLFFSKRWWWDFVDSTAARRFLYASYTLYASVERGLVEVLGPTGVKTFLSQSYDLFRNRGWFSTFWLSGLVGFAFLIVTVQWSETSAVPLVPFAMMLQPKKC